MFVECAAPGSTGAIVVKADRIAACIAAARTPGARSKLRALAVSMVVASIAENSPVRPVRLAGGLLRARCLFCGEPGDAHGELCVWKLARIAVGD